jgi:eukaryotic-like serine/threonine-protein kinase
MAFGSVADFVESLRKHQLLKPGQLDELTRFVQPRFSETPGLAKELVRRGWLTVFQINQLFQANGQDLVLGPFRIIDYLGKGGVSQVFKAWHTGRNCVVALKVIHSDLLTNADAVRRFEREMRVVGKLNHPNVVRAFEDDAIGAAHFYAMEFVEGTDLNKLVQLGGPLPPATACACARQAALGLQHAHELGLIHRDIKPANLVLIKARADQPADVVKVLDFGLARLRATPDQASPDVLTAEGALIGTADYLSPEQAVDPRYVDIRADIYSLGCTFHFLLTGAPPYPGKAIVEKLYKHRNAPLPEVPGLQPHVAAVLNKMMAKQPAERYQTPAEVAKALEP